MSETDNSKDGSIIEQLGRVLKDAVDYAASAITLLQTRITAMALSGVAFAALLFMAGLLAIAALSLLGVALGVWLTHATGSAVWALLIMGAVLALIAFILGRIALGWLDRLNS